MSFVEFCALPITIGMLANMIVGGFIGVAFVRVFAYFLKKLMDRNDKKKTRNKWA